MTCVNQNSLSLNRTQLKWRLGLSPCNTQLNDSALVVASPTLGLHAGALCLMPTKGQCDAEASFWPFPYRVQELCSFGVKSRKSAGCRARFPAPETQQ